MIITISFMTFYMYVVRVAMQPGEVRKFQHFIQNSGKIRKFENFLKFEVIFMLSLKTRCLSILSYIGTLNGDFSLFFLIKSEILGNIICN